MQQPAYGRGAAVLFWAGECGFLLQEDTAYMMMRTLSLTMMFVLQNIIVWKPTRMREYTLALMFILRIMYALWL